MRIMKIRAIEIDRWGGSETRQSPPWPIKLAVHLIVWWAGRDAVKQYGFPGGAFSIHVYERKEG